MLSGRHPSCGFIGWVARFHPSGQSGGHSLPGIHSFGSTPGGALDESLSLLILSSSSSSSSSSPFPTTTEASPYSRIPCFRYSCMTDHLGYHVCILLS